MASIPHLSGIKKDGVYYGIRFGTGAPAPSLGFDGEIYIDKEAFLFYGPKTAGGWGPSYGAGDFDAAAIIDRINVLEAVKPVKSINGATPDPTGDIVIAGALPTAFIRQYVADGVTNAFDVGLADVPETIALVTVNGVIQRPTIDYTVVGTTLSFTEMPDNLSSVAIRVLGSNLDMLNSYAPKSTVFTKTEIGDITEELADLIDGLAPAENWLAKTPLVVPIVNGELDLNLSLSMNFDITLTEPAVLYGQEEGFQIGQSGSIIVRQDNVGGRTLALHSKFVLPVGGVNITTTANAVTIIPYMVIADGEIRLFTAVKW